MSFAVLMRNPTPADAYVFLNLISGQKGIEDWNYAVKEAAARFEKPFRTEELCQALKQSASRYVIDKVEPILFRLGYTRETIGKYRDYPAQPIKYFYKYRWSQCFNGQSRGLYE